ncbi:MAG: phosphodiester glycosidase family protein [Cyanobacteria bacterium J06642_2]
MSRSSRISQSSWGARSRKWLWRTSTGVAIALLVLAAYLWWQRPVPVPPTEIFQGVSYRCERLAPTPEARGLMHLVEVDLTAPGLELYVTPLDEFALGQGWQYRLRWSPRVVRAEQLSVMVTGTLSEFADPRWLQWPGRFARSLETLVADGQLSHVHEHSYMLWFADDLTPHLEKGKPPSPTAIQQARWAVSGQGVHLKNGIASGFADRVPDARVLVGIDGERQKLFLGVFERASTKVAAELMGVYGAVDAISLDGGTSSTIAIGRGAKGIRPRTLLFPKRFIPTHFGIRALPIYGSRQAA